MSFFFYAKIKEERGHETETKAFYGRIYGYAHTGWNTLYEWYNSICS